MNIFTSHYDFLKESASILLKRAQNAAAPDRSDALARFRAVEPYASRTDVRTDELQLKDSLAVVAAENGYATWTELKGALDRAAESSPLAEIKDQFYPKGFTTYWNIWFAKYAQAKKVLQDGGGYLLPYRNQYFIVEEHFVDSIGIPHTLPEWETIGRDWVHPKQVKAWLRLNDVAAAALKERQGQ